MSTITLPNLAPFVNKAEYSIEIKITKDGKEKTFNLPWMVDDQVWGQMFKPDITPLEHTVEISNYSMTFSPTQPQ
jgi:hypothetical protein